MQLILRTSIVMLILPSLAWADLSPAQPILDQLNASLAKLGVPHVQGSELVGERNTPALYFGSSKINNHFELVDEFRKKNWVTATVFVKDGSEYTRVSTNVLTSERKRGVGTQLAHNDAYAALEKGRPYCGAIEVLGIPYDACYSPIVDNSGKTIGATYIGYKK